MTTGVNCNSVPLLLHLSSECKNRIQPLHFWPSIITQMWPVLTGIIGAGRPGKCSLDEVALQSYLANESTPKVLANHLRIKRCWKWKAEDHGFHSDRRKYRNSVKPTQKNLAGLCYFCVIHQVLGILSVVGAVNIGIQKGERYSPYKFIKCIIMYYKWWIDVQLCRERYRIWETGGQPLWEPVRAP